MKSNSRGNKYFNCLTRLSVITAILIVSNGTLVSGGELIPFPSGQQQQKGIDPWVYTEFRAQVEMLNCASLQQVREDLIKKNTSCRNSAEKEYYERLIGILEEVRSRNCVKK